MGQIAVVTSDVVIYAGSDIRVTADLLNDDHCQLIAEVGELSELFMWKGEVRKGLADWDEAEKEHLGEELSDVLLYLIRLSDMCGVDLGDAATRKIVKNAVKYPAPSKEGA
ncbi:uncharacterized protein [Miscanthus floridulus]|uniref:uncharacterized protein n=1 Tax=Miscanthus floridulus TaxID=154761 RepID=UPI0034589AAB